MKSVLQTIDTARRKDTLFGNEFLKNVLIYPTFQKTDSEQ